MPRNAASPSFSFDPTALRVLVVDDSAPMRGIIGSILKSHGTTEIEMASDGLEALGLVRRARFDFIICDLMMQGMDGFEFLRQLRKATPYPACETPTIILSSNGDLNSILQARDAGMNEYLVKPISPKTLWNRVTSLMNRPFKSVQESSHSSPMTSHSNTGERTQAAGSTSEPQSHRGQTTGEEADLFTPELMDRYMVILRKEVQALEALVRGMAASQEPVRSDWIDLVRKTHDLKGHSGSFGFNLISDAAGALCAFGRSVLDNIGAFRERRRPIMDLVVSLSDAITHYTAQDIRDDAVEQEYVSSLLETARKLESSFSSS
jgi:two-component system, chemotaxis family, chemotaxis protein CheY